MTGNGPPLLLTPTLQESQTRRLRRPWSEETASSLRYPRVRLRHLLAPLKTALPLAIADQAAVLCCVALAVALVGLFGMPLEAASVWTVAAASGAGLLIGYWAFGLYPGIGINPVNETRQAVLASTTVFGVAVTMLFIEGRSTAAAFLLSLVWVLSLVVLPVGRMSARSAFSRFPWWRRPIAVLGDGESAQRVAARLRRCRTLGLEPIGHVNHFQDHWSDQSAALNYMGPPQQVADLIEAEGVHWAILALPEKSQDHAELLAAALLFPNVLIVDESCTLPSLWSRTVDIDGCSGRHTHHLFGVVPRQFKRCFDAATAGALTVLLAPAFLLIGLLIRLTSPGPIFYGQERVGRGGRPFRAWKFRTMVPDADRVLEDYLKSHPELRQEWEQNHKLKKDPRIIPGIGRLLRHYSLDELPQLWNVLCGQMSLVGPRPIVEEEIPKYQDDFALYVQVSPGLTGLWQISGRNNTTYQRRVFLDCYYIRNWSPWLDFYILLRTVKTVLLREGAY